MHVAFAFFEGDELLHRGEFLIGVERTLSVYGQHSHVPLSKGMVFSHTPEIQLFSGLVIHHSLELPACPVSMQYYVVKPGQAGQMPVQERALNCEMRMGVHTSDEWESLDFSPYTLAFRCAVAP
jgi:hypothetical protein